MTPMVIAVLLAALAGVPGTAPGAPADAVGLAPQPAIVGRPATPRPPRPRLPALPGALGIGGAAAVVASAGAAARRKRSVPDTMLFVFVPGHGGDPEGFAAMAERLGSRDVSRN